MKYNIIMPKLGESVTEGSIVKWLVKPGDTIKQYDNILEVETDKVVAEVPSTQSGVIKEILFKEGDTVKVGTVICIIEDDATQSNLNTEEDSNTSASFMQDNKSKQHNQQINNIDNANVQVNKNFSNINKSSKRYSPAVLTLANQHGINLEFVQGTGFEERITRKDVLNYIANSSNQPQVGDKVTIDKVDNVNSINPSNINTQQEHLLNGDTLIEVSSIRKTIAKKMLESVSNIPHAWMTIEVDATNLVSIREKIKKDFLNKEGFPITYFAFFVTEVVKALHKFPLLNSVWQDNHILLKKDINISIAVAAENNLFVPVIQQADTQNVKGIAKEIFNLANKAKNNLLTASDIQGGTFTINNTGSFGSISSMGIINYPQAAILQIESIVKRPVVINNMIAIRDMVNLSLSIDHRIMDGLVAGNFLKQVKYNIENISQSVIA